MTCQTKDKVLAQSQHHSKLSLTHSQKEILKDLLMICYQVYLMSFQGRVKHFNNCQQSIKLSDMTYYFQLIVIWCDTEQQC
jgi:hypothetical protein